MTEQTGNNKPNEAEGLAFPLSGNEKLIEDAANERYPDIEANPKTFPTGWSREQERNAFIAGAVFEKALTPTDDEREALDWALRYARRYWQHGGEPESQRALSVLASALRRSEVPEPTGDEREALGIMILRVADEEKPVWEAGLDAIVDAVAGFRSGEVLVEGSWFKRDDLPTVLGNFMRSSNEYARQAKELHVALTELRSLEPQGEPSDARAKVIDALVMTRLSDFAGTDMGVIEQAADAVLAALRAAGGVR